jgi:hypothetical protein
MNLFLILFVLFDLFVFIRGKIFSFYALMLKRAPDTGAAGV